MIRLPQIFDCNRRGPYCRLRRVTGIVIIVLTALVGISLVINLRELRQHTRELARMEALTTFNKDQAFRFWATNHGGVYVPPTEKTPPNPYLSHIPDRDLLLPSGKRLTLMNPAYIMKQAMAEYSELYGVKGHITSLKPLNPANAPDEWESEALTAFETGGMKERIEFTKIGGVPYLRLMQPMITKKGCLKCHAHQGYKVGDVRGGVSVTLPMAPYLAEEAEMVHTMLSSHLFVWGIGVAGIGYAYRRGRIDIFERIKAQEAIRSKEERFRNIVETTNDMIWEVDRNGVYTYVSPKARLLLGYGPEELIGKTPFDFMPFDEARRVRDVFSEKLASVEPFSSLENTNITKDRRLVVLETVGMPFFDSKGKVLGYRGIDRDITGRKKSEEELKKALSDLTSSNADLQQFAFIASHDLQEPVHAVSSYLKLLSRRLKGTLDPETEGFVDSAMNGMSRMESMIKDLLELSRVSTSGEAFEMVDSGALLDNALENLSASIKESGASVKVDKLPMVNADQAQLVRLFQNLVGNALKFRRVDAVPVIEIGAVESSEVWVFSVKDNGIGIAPENMENVFVIFQRFHKEYPGTGIGLAICKKIVERHGGRIWVESTQGKGSVFYFSLPKARRS